MFSFDKNEIVHHMMNKMGLRKQLEESFEFIFSKLVESGVYIENWGENEVEEEHFKQDKNYNWLATTIDGVDVIIRGYQNHFTIMTSMTAPEFSHLKKYLTAFTMSINEDLLPDDLHDVVIDDPTRELNKYLSGAIALVKDLKTWLVWNTLSLKLPEEKQRPEYSKMEVIFEDREITSIDDFVFLVEEISEQHLSFYAETEMIEHIKKIKIGDEINGKKVTKITTEADCVHSIGLAFDEEHLQDVRCLTRYYLNDIKEFLKI